MYTKILIEVWYTYSFSFFEFAESDNGKEQHFNYVSNRLMKESVLCFLSDETYFWKCNYLG